MKATGSPRPFSVAPCVARRRTGRVVLTASVCGLAASVTVGRALARQGAIGSSRVALKHDLRGQCHLWAMPLTPTRYYRYYQVPKFPSAEPNLVLADWGRPGGLFERGWYSEVGTCRVPARPVRQRKIRVLNPSPLRQAQGERIKDQWAKRGRHTPALRERGWG